MKIAIFCHPFFPLKQPYAGGLEMIVDLLIKALNDVGHHVVVYAHPKSEISVELVAIDVTDSEIAGKYDLEGNDQKQCLVELAFAKAVQHISVNGFDVVHNHTLDSIAFLALSKLNIPVLNTFHTPVFPSLIMAVEMMKDWDNMYTSAVSKSLASKYLPSLPDIHTIYNGISVSSWDFNDHVSEDYIFWCGRICKEKGTDDAIKFALKAKKKLIIAGPKFVDDYFNEFVAPHLDNDLIEYVGHLNHRVLNRYMSSASLFLFTSIWDEPYGLVLAEALSCGTPVLGYNVGAASEIIDEYSGVLVPVGEIDSLVEGMEDAYRINRINCRYRAEKFCDYRQMTNSYTAVYKEIIQNYKESI